MPQSVEKTASQAAMVRAQESKSDFMVKVREAEEDKSLSVVFSTREAAFALGISQTVFQTLAERGGVFVIEVINDHNVVMSLKLGVSGYRRNLWDEMIATLRVGRSSHGQTKDAYEFLYRAAQVCHRGTQEEIQEAFKDPPSALSSIEAFVEFRDYIRDDGGVHNEDLIMLQGLCYAFFGGLEHGTREVLEDKMPPWLVFQEGE